MLAGTNLLQTQKGVLEKHTHTSPFATTNVALKLLHGGIDVFRGVLDHSVLFSFEPFFFEPLPFADHLISTKLIPSFSRPLL